MKSYTLDLPLTVPFGSKDIGLNLNHYRNAHHYILSALKINFTALVTPQLDNIPRLVKLKLDYTLWLGTNRKADLMNIGAIVDKFFCDTLTANGKIPDDNIDYITDISFHFGGVDKLNPRMVVIITDIDS